MVSISHAGLTCSHIPGLARDGVGCRYANRGARIEEICFRTYNFNLDFIKRIMKSLIGSRNHLCDTSSGKVGVPCVVTFRFAEDFASLKKLN